MVPTLWGRIQTRLALLATVGLVVTAVVTPLLPAKGPLGGRYATTYLLLATVAVLGVAWEFVYHLLMQFRWEKDWPTLFGLLTLAPEGALVWFLAERGFVPGLTAPSFAAFSIHIVVTWLSVWLFANGPMRVPFPRWRFHGGRLI
jgi:hypothetical protein